MIVKIEKSEIKSGMEIEAPPSKSITHRAFALAMLAKGASRIINPLIAEDTLATINACEAFGAEIEGKKEKHDRDKKVFTVHGTGGELKKPEREIDVKNSGTTLRLFSAIAALDEEALLTGDESIRQRPMQALINALNSLGAEARSLNKNGKAPVLVKGKLKGGRASISGAISSQFISALLIASTYAEKTTEITIKDELVSKPYVDITLRAMHDFGVKAENQDYKRFIIEPGKYKARDYVIEGDYSSASFFLALAAIKRINLKIKNLRKDSLQGDKRIIDILEKMGAKIERTKDYVLVKGEEIKELESTEISLKDNPDLLPVIAMLACFANGETVIKEAAHARFKESDRIKSCTEELAKLGAEIKELKDGVEINGKKELKGATVNSHGDHRIAMALAIAATEAEGRSEIINAESVKISFPEFFENLKRLGARIL